MGESIAHIKLVEQMEEWVRYHIIDAQTILYVDHPRSVSKPPLINGYRPDLYIPKSNFNSLIIGEAKTGKDLNNLHTSQQFISYIVKCSEYDNSKLIIAVPWQHKAYVNNYLQALIRKNKLKVIKIIVLDYLKDY